jgi:hypothetical protein
MSDKPTNPKDALGTDKLPLHLWPETASAFGCVALANGMLKYGRNNFRDTGVRATIYIDAARRHLEDWAEGFDHDPEDGVHNLSGVLASIAILIEAMCAGKLVDDRNFNGKGWRVARAMMEPHVKRLRELHAGRNPKHWTIADNAPTAPDSERAVNDDDTIGITGLQYKRFLAYEANRERFSAEGQKREKECEQKKRQQRLTALQSMPLRAQLTYAFTEVINDTSIDEGKRILAKLGVPQLRHVPDADLVRALNMCRKELGLPELRVLGPGMPFTVEPADWMARHRSNALFSCEGFKEGRVLYRCNRPQCAENFYVPLDGYPLAEHPVCLDAAP